MIFCLRSVIVALVAASVLGPVSLDAAGAADPVPEGYFGTLEWRSIGPARGGRASSVAGIPGDPLTYYMGACGGGVWKTTNAGSTWSNVTDGFLGTGSVGAVTVAPSDPNVVYVGMGEPDIRGNFSHGDGVYRSVDAGRTWTHLGLADTRQIGRIVVHPDDPDTVLVAAMGHVFSPNAERGVFKSTDGGATWRNVLFVDDKAGAVDLSIDPHNPRNLFAATWEVHRTPWGLSSGGEGSGLHRSRDGGETWERLAGGLPEGLVGRIGVSASAAQRDLVWAIVEAEKGGVFKSTDGGDTWRRVNEDRSLRQRAWYYTRIHADTREPDTVYVMNVGFHKSRDGGRTFSTIRVPHSDNHALWIAPEDNRRMVNANDGGANVSFDGGSTWSRQDNQPTAQFYHVTTDNNFPYRVLGAQQDNSTVSISSRNRPGWWREEFHAVGGGESGYIAVRPDDPDIVFAGSYGGHLTRYDHRTGKRRNIMAWPENPIGAGAVDLEYRFQWTFPIVISPHDPDVVYVAANVLFRSDDQGQTWEPISPDLTTDDETKQQSSGGPITKDNTSVEYYCTIFAVAESPLEAGLIWAGTDDGLVHVTDDSGANWREVTPPGMGDWPQIAIVEASSHDADTAYLAVNRYKMDDFAPYIYRTTDRGATWTLIADGIDDDAFVRVVREDPVRKGLLYAGTETGVWVSFNDGGTWQPLQLKLPVVPITDLVVKDDDLVVSTQGRSFWILDDISTLRQHSSAVVDADVHLFTPARTWRQRWDAVKIRYHLAEEPEAKVVLEILDGEGTVVRTLDGAKPVATGGRRAPKPPADAGMNLFRWDMRVESPRRVPGAVGWPGTPSGPLVPPGAYTVRLTIGDEQWEQPFEIAGDPRVETTSDEYREQFDFLVEVCGAVDRAHAAVNKIRSVRGQVNDAVARAKHSDGHAAIRDAGKALSEGMTAIEETILQTRSKSPQDPLNFPVRLNDKLGALAGAVGLDYRPTAQVRAVYAKLSAALEEQTDALDALLAEDVPAFNQLVHDHAVPAIVLEEKAADEDGDQDEHDE